MLDVSFLEISVVLIVALLVIGPQRLPRVARYVGRCFAKCRRLWQTLQKESKNNIEENNSDEK